MANGTNQIEGRDYNEIFSPVVKAISIRIVLMVVVTRGWNMTQLDISNAFLHGQLKENIFMWQTIGFMDETQLNHVCRLRKVLYGLKQVSWM